MSRRLTVVQMLPAMEAGGVERGTIEVSEALVKAGHRAIVISGGGKLVSRLKGRGAEHLEWPVGQKSLWTFRWVKRLRRWLESERPDIVHARSRLPAWIAWRAWRRMDPATRPRFVTTLHGLHSVSRYSAVMTRGERVICVSEAAREYALANYSGTDPERLVVIPRGVDRRVYPYRYSPTADWLTRWLRDMPMLETRRVLTLAGRINRRKGFEAHIDLVAALAGDGMDVHGLAVGPVSADREKYLKELERRVRSKGIEGRYTFIGARDDLREVFAMSDLVLSLSVKPEAFGRTVTEALSLGRPVVGWDHGGVGEQLQAIYPAGAVPPGDMEALVDTTRRLLQSPAPVPSNQPYTLERMLEATLSLYEELAAESFSGRSSGSD